MILRNVMTEPQSLVVVPSASTPSVTTLTDLLTGSVPEKDVQYLAGHADPRTTQLYDRRQKRVTRNIVERISV
jgi:integrase